MTNVEIKDVEIVMGGVVSKGKIFFGSTYYGIPHSLEACNNAGYRALFMPELAIVRTNTDIDLSFWENSFLTPSVMVTGRTKQGNPVVVYAHIPTSLSNPFNIIRIIDNKLAVNGAGPMPEDEFYNLLNQEGNGGVFVVDHVKLMKSTFGSIRIHEALTHPQTIPFLGGEQIARAYLAKCENVAGSVIIGYNDDLGDRPMGSVLGIGASSGYSRTYSEAFGCERYYSDRMGHVLGVKCEIQERSLEKKVVDEDLKNVEGTIILERNFRRDGLFRRIFGRKS